MHARQRRQAMQARQAAQPLISNDRAVTALPATATLPKVAIDPATATLDTVPSDPATAMLPAVPMDPATPTLDTVAADPATSALPTVATDAITPTPAVVATDSGASRSFINIAPASQAPEDRAEVRGVSAPIRPQRRPARSLAAGRYRDGVADNEVMDFDGGAATGSRYPSGVFDVGREPDPLYTLANERTYLSWLRLAVTLLAGAVAIDRLFLENPWFGSQILALALVVIAFATCGIGVRRWWATETALRLRRPLPGFSAPLLGAAAILLGGVGVVLLVLTPRA